MRTAFRISVLLLVPLLASCASTQTPEARIAEQDRAMTPPVPNVTSFTSAVDQFGTMLRAYPRALTDPVPIEVQAIQNTSGVTDGLPTDLAPVLRNILAKVGRPVEVVEIDQTQLHIDLQLMQQGQLDSTTMIRRIPQLSVRGSITEGETRLRKGWGVQMDALIPVRSGRERITTHPGGSVTTLRRDEELDIGFGTDREVEVTTLAIDLQLFDYFRQTSIHRLAESYRVNVVRSDESYAFGIFFEGSGLGFRSRVVGMQSKSRALRMASELAIIHLLGRYFRVPWWRIVTDVTTDAELVRWYRDSLEESSAAGELKLLLYAHGYDANLGAEGLTRQEIDLSRKLKQELGFAPFAEDNDYDFITRLWETVPFERTARRMDRIRREWHARTQEARSQPAPAQPSTAPSDATPPPSNPGYPTVAKCCPFRFEPATEGPPSGGG